MEKGINRDAKDDKGFTPYYYLNEGSYFPEKERLLSLMQSKGVPVKYDAALVQKAFFRAVESGKAMKVHEYLQQGADPNRLFTISLRFGFRRAAADELPPLMVALVTKQALMAQLLLLYGADPNVSHSNEHLLYRSPLSIALDNGMDDVARMLIYKGADLNFVPKSNNTYTCQYEIPLKDYIDQYYPGKKSFFGWDTNGNTEAYPVRHSSEKDSIFLRAVADQNREKLHQVFEDDYQDAEYYGSSSRTEAWKDILFQNASYDFLQFFLDKEASGFIQYNYHGAKDIKVLNGAAVAGNAGLVSELLKNHTYELSPNWSRRGAERYLNPMVNTIKSGARLNSPARVYQVMKRDEQVVLDEAQRRQYLDVVRVLANSNFYQDSVCIATSIRSRFFEATAFFLRKQAVSDPQRKAFLNIIDGNTEALNRQLAAGLSPDTRLYGFSLLACAAWMDQPDIFLLLLEKGAATETEKPEEGWHDNAHLRPELWAVIHGNKRIMEALAKRNVSFDELYLNNVYSYPSTVYTAPFLLMTRKEKRDVFEGMLKNGWIDHMHGYRIHTLLTMAISWDDPQLVRLLLKYPPDSEEIKQNRKQFAHKAPGTVLETIAYALVRDAEACFFDLIQDHDFKLADLKEQKLPYYPDIANIKSLKLQQWLLDQGVKVQSYYKLLSMLHNALEQQALSHFLRLMSITENEEFKYDGRTYEDALRKNQKLQQQIIESEGTEVLNAILTYEESLGLTGEGGVSWLELSLKNDQIEKVRFLLKRGKNWIGPDDYYRNVMVYMPDFARNFDTWKSATQAIEKTLKVR